MLTRADENNLRRAMQVQFDSMDLPESLTSRLGEPSPVAEQSAWEPVELSRTEGTPRRKQRTALVLAAASSVVAVALAAAILTQRSTEPDSTGPRTVSASASAFSSTIGATVTSLPTSPSLRSASLAPSQSSSRPDMPSVQLKAHDFGCGSKPVDEHTLGVTITGPVNVLNRSAGVTVTNHREVALYASDAFLVLTDQQGSVISASSVTADISSTTVLAAKTTAVLRLKGWPVQLCAARKYEGVLPAGTYRAHYLVMFEYNGGLIAATGPAFEFTESLAQPTK